MIINGDIPNLLNGVSQQAMALRLPTQLDLQENFYSTLVDGLKKRPPAELVARIVDEAPDGAFFHIIDRDQDEQYVVIITEGSLRVFDFDGEEQAVTFPDGTDYLDGLTVAAEDIRALTVADYSFIVNRQKVVEMGEDVFPPRAAEALINITAGNYDKRYRIDIDGVPKAEYGTPSGSNNKYITANNGLPPSDPAADIWKGGQTLDEPSISGDPLNGDVGLRPNQAVATTEIAKRLRANLIDSLDPDGDPWGVGIYTNALHIVNYDEDFAVAGEDGVNGNAMRVVKDKTARFSDLPNYGPLGFTVEIAGANGINADNYWVKIEKGNNPNNSSVTWREVPKPGTVRGFDAATMPHILVRNADNTFTFKQAVWDERKCGDGELVNGDPSFVGRPIEDVFFHKNRLGFLSDESCIMSRAGSYFDFFRTTATALLDDDPIDVAAAHIKVSFLKHAVPFQDVLLLFSAETQFRLAGNELLTPKTASIRPLTEYSCSRGPKPVVIGKTVFFVSDEKSDAGLTSFATAYEMAYDKKLETVEAAEITAHTPAYIPAGIHKIAGSVDESCLAVLTRGDQSAIYVYRYYWQGEEKVQSSWSRWTLDGATVLDAQWINSDLYVVASRADGVFLERLQMDTAAQDPEVGFLVGLDRRVRAEDAAVLPDQPVPTSEVELPYPASPSIRCVEIAGPGAIVGREIKVLGVDGHKVHLSGNLTGRTLLLGYAYESRARFSQFFPRMPSQTGGLTTRQDGRLQVQHLAVVYDNAGYFRVEVHLEGRPPSINQFNGFIIGTDSGYLGQLNLARGRLNVPIMSRNSRVKIEIVNDSWLPSAFVTASWRGLWNQKGREV